MNYSPEYLIIGGGIVGLAVALRLRERHPGATIQLIEKEAEVAEHASGRNSGVLHSGFYYTADSLKARFTVEGNKALRRFCEAEGLPVNRCGKLVVARDARELEVLRELERRGKRNGSNVAMLSLSEAEQIEPNVRSFQNVLFAPDTATVDPAEVCLRLKDRLCERGVEVLLNTRYLGWDGEQVRTTAGAIRARKVINCAGLYADRIAHDFGFGLCYRIIPFKGLYLKYVKNDTDIRTNIYPVPNLRNPFLGVHFTKTVDGHIKIGPTAIPAFWRENYSGMSRWRAGEAIEIMWSELRLFATNAFQFRSLAFEEMRKYNRSHFIGLARDLVKTLDTEGFGDFTRPGIRAQLFNTSSLELVQDFVVEGDDRSVHVLNAVSPAFTCCFPFAEYVVDKYVLPR